MIRILHTGDLHLCSPFSGLSIEESAKRRAAQYEILGRIADYARKMSVSLVLIAGDLFDGRDITPDAAETILSTIASIPCPVVVSPGNHDPYVQGSVYRRGDLPENLYVFTSEELQYFSFSQFDVYGYAFTSDALPVSPLAAMPDGFAKSEKISILLAHADLDTPLSKYAPLSSADLARSGIDYAALGHIHNAEREPIDFGGGYAAYCGFAEGRSFDECGFGGFRLITIAPHSKRSGRINLTVETVRIAEHRYMEARVDLTGAERDTEAIERIRALCKSEGYGRETTLRVFLEGEVSPRYTPGCEEIAAACTDPELPEAPVVVDRTLPIYDAGYLEEDLTIRGALYRTLKEAMLSGSPEERVAAADALRVGLAALDGRPIIG